MDEEKYTQKTQFLVTKGYITHCSRICESTLTATRTQTNRQMTVLFLLQYKNYELVPNSCTQYCLGVTMCTAARKDGSGLKGVSPSDNTSPRMKNQVSLSITNSWYSD